MGRMCVQVKFTLPFRVGLGEGWKIVGKCPELGNMTPEVAPYMTWNNGDVWSLEARMRPGKFIYKVRCEDAGGARPVVHLRWLRTFHRLVVCMSQL